MTKSLVFEQWVVYPEEGHGWLELEALVDFWTRVEMFLNRNSRVDAEWPLDLHGVRCVLAKPFRR